MATPITVIFCCNNKSLSFSLVLLYMLTDLGFYRKYMQDLFYTTTKVVICLPCGNPACAMLTGYCVNDTYE